MLWGKCECIRHFLFFKILARCTLLSCNVTFQWRLMAKTSVNFFIRDSYLHPFSIIILVVSLSYHRTLIRVLLSAKPSPSTSPLVFPRLLVASYTHCRTYYRISALKRRTTVYITFFSSYRLPSSP